MNYAICAVAAAPVRKEDSHRTEMVNQLLFGETMQVLEEKEEWCRIISIYDDYEGWLTRHMIVEIEEETARYPVGAVSTGLINTITLPHQIINAPMGSSLTGFNSESRILWDGVHRYHGTCRNVRQPVYDLDLFWQTVHAWLNAPYLWGGRTFLGVDCSGFVQVVFKVLGIRLKRDAWQQATQGRAVISLKKAETGDVAFFENEAGKIVHVGILLNNRQIIHASGKVRIDHIREEGIIQADTGKQTHRLHSIRRLF